MGGGAGSKSLEVAVMEKVRMGRVEGGAGSKSLEVAVMEKVRGWAGWREGPAARAWRWR